MGSIYRISISDKGDNYKTSIDIVGFINEKSEIDIESGDAMIYAFTPNEFRLFIEACKQVLSIVEMNNK